MTKDLACSLTLRTKSLQQQRCNLFTCHTRLPLPSRISNYTRPGHSICAAKNLMPRARQQRNTLPKKCGDHARKCKIYHLLQWARIPSYPLTCHRQFCVCLCGRMSCEKCSCKLMRTLVVAHGYTPGLFQTRKKGKGSYVWESPRCKHRLSLGLPYFLLFPFIKLLKI